MSKELEELLETINSMIETCAVYELHKCPTNIEISKKELLSIQHELKHLQSIDNANPSEALECLEEIIHEFNEPHYELSGEYSYKNELLRRCEDEVNTIKQALLKLQELEKEHARDFGKDIINLNKTLKQVIDKPILYASRYGNKYIVSQKSFEEQEKLLKIIFENDINFEVFGAFETYKDYEIYYDKKFHLIENKLTEDEFDTIKRWKECQKN